jgi:hypothetical protein
MYALPLFLKRQRDRTRQAAPGRIAVYLVLFRCASPTRTQLTHRACKHRPCSAGHLSALWIVGVVFCVLFIQRGREKSAKGAYLEISSSSKHYM